MRIQGSLRIKFTLYSFVFFLMGTALCQAQSSEELVHELTDLIKSRNRMAEVFYTEHQGALFINGNRIPVAEIQIYYEDKRSLMMVLQCSKRTNVNCIFNAKADRKVESISVPMDDRESIDRAYEIIEQLKG